MADRVRTIPLIPTNGGSTRPAPGAGKARTGTGRVQKIALVQTTHLGTSRPEIGLGNGFLKNYLKAYGSGDYEIESYESNDFMANVVNRAGDFDIVAVSTVSYL